MCQYLQIKSVFIGNLQVWPFLMIVVCFCLIFCALQKASTPQLVNAVSEDESGKGNLGFLHAFVASISVIIVSELGDKTFFIAAIMAMRYNRIVVLAGAMLALGVMTCLSGWKRWKDGCVCLFLTLVQIYSNEVTATFVFQCCLDMPPPLSPESTHTMCQLLYLPFSEYVCWERGWKWVQMKVRRSWRRCRQRSRKKMKR